MFTQITASFIHLDVFISFDFLLNDVILVLLLHPFAVEETYKHGMYVLYCSIQSLP